MTIDFIGAFESCYLPQHDVDVAEMTGHSVRWREDLALLRCAGVTKLRYPIRWHRIETEPGVFDWSYTDEVLDYLGERGFDPIVDLVHHCSYPLWLAGGFADPRWPRAYLRYLEAFACRYEWVPAYTLLNEPFTTLWLTSHEGIWPPYGRGIESFVSTALNVIPALTEGARMYRDLLPDARHVYVEPCEGHSASTDAGEAYAELANDRRFFVLDLILGRGVDTDRPFMHQVAVNGGEALLQVEPGSIDVLGLDYYAHLEWCFDGVGGLCPSPRPRGLAALILDYRDRYGLPMILGETNIRGYSTDRVSWLKYTLEQCEKAASMGARVDGYCWFPVIDSMDWDTLLANADRHVDPVGVYWLDEDLERRTSVMSQAYAFAAAGAPSSALPAYTFQPPLDRWLKGLLPQMSHWEWQDPCIDGMCAATTKIHADWEVADVAV